MDTHQKDRKNFSPAREIHPQFFLEGCHSPYRLGISRKNGCLSVYIKGTIPSRQLSLPKFQFKIQALPFEMNPSIIDIQTT